LRCGAPGISGVRQMMGEKFGLPFDEVGKLPFQSCGNATVQLLPPATQQIVVDRVLHQRMLEQVGRCRR
jgi:hypothetical protein